MKLNEKIKEERIKLNMTQEQLAAEVYVTRVSVSNWETGKTYPDIDSLLLLSKLFNISIDTLVKDEVIEIENNLSLQKLGKLQMLYQVSIVLFIIIFLISIIHTNLYGYEAGIIYIGIFIGLAILLSIIERKIKQFEIETPLEIYEFVKGSSLKVIKDKRNNKKIKYFSVYMLIIGFVTSIAVQLIIRLVM